MRVHRIKLMIFWVLVALPVLGCRGGEEKPGYHIYSGMYDSIPYDSYDRNPVLSNNMTLLQPPEGTVPTHRSPFRYGKGPKEALRAGRELKNPLQPTEKNLARAKQLFETFCAVCHGPKGVGDGPIIGRFPNPPNLLAKHGKGLKDGNIFHVITYGQGKLMSSYANQVRPMDRWRLVMYVRKLQKPPAKKKAQGKAAKEPVKPAPAAPPPTPAAPATGAPPSIPAPAPAPAPATDVAPPSAPVAPSAAPPSVPAPAPATDVAPPSGTPPSVPTAAPTRPAESKENNR